VIGFFILLGAMISSAFIPTTGLSLAIGAGFVLFACVSILFQTSLVKGGEKNYVMATISFYVSIYNLFVSLLSIFGFLSKDE
jgi:modulator of FtsH protease